MDCFSCKEKREFNFYFVMNMEIMKRSSFKEDIVVYRLTHDRSSKSQFLATIVVKTLTSIVNHQPPLHKCSLCSPKNYIDLINAGITCTLVSGYMNMVDYGCLDLKRHVEIRNIMRGRHVLNSYSLLLTHLS